MSAAPQTAIQVAKPPLRPRELEDWLNFHLYHPLAWRLALRLAKTPLTPNMVSVGGALAIWDNRVVQHKGIKDYAGGGRRVLYRATMTA